MRRFLVGFLIIFSVSLLFASCAKSKTERLETGEQAGELINEEAKEAERLLKEKEDLIKSFPSSVCSETFYDNGYYLFRRVYVRERGMDYVFYDEGDGVQIVNLTKDSLEVELLKRHLQQ